MTKRRLRRGSFASLVDLQAAIKRYLAETNADPKPFVRTAEPDGVIERRSGAGTKRPSRSTCTPKDRVGRDQSPAMAMHSTSSRAPSAKAATATVERAGGASGKNVL